MGEIPGLDTRLSERGQLDAERTLEQLRGEARVAAEKLDETLVIPGAIYNPSSWRTPFGKSVKREVAQRSSESKRLLWLVGRSTPPFAVGVP